MRNSGRRDCLQTRLHHSRACGVPDVTHLVQPFRGDGARHTASYSGPQHQVHLGCCEVCAAEGAAGSLQPGHCPFAYSAGRHRRGAHEIRQGRFPGERISFLIPRRLPGSQGLGLWLVYRDLRFTDKGRELRRHASVIPPPHGRAEGRRRPLLAAFAAAPGGIRH